VLQSETCSLSGGEHHWFKRITSGKETGGKRYDDDSNDTPVSGFVWLLFQVFAWMLITCTSIEPHL